MDRLTNEPTDRWTNERTHPLIELQGLKTKNIAKVTSETVFVGIVPKSQCIYGLTMAIVIFIGLRAFE